MQLDKLIHIARLIDKKYFLSYIFSILFSLLSLIVLDTNWASLDLRLEVDTPLFKTTIPASEIFLKGWDVMGFFGVFSFLPIIFIFFKSLKKKAWIVAVSLIPVTLVNGMNISEVIDWILSLTLDYVSLTTTIYFPFYGYLFLSSLLSISTYFISFDEP